jgi:hypothetical protein
VAMTAKDILELDLAARLMSGTLSGPRGGACMDTMSGAADRGVR